MIWNKEICLATGKQYFYYPLRKSQKNINKQLFTKRTKQINVYSVNAIAVTNILKSYY